MTGMFELLGAGFLRFLAVFDRFLTGALMDEQMTQQDTCNGNMIRIGMEMVRSNSGPSGGGSSSHMQPSMLKVTIMLKI